MSDTPSEGDRIIRASEIGRYAYCARAWWLGSVQGLRPRDTRPLQAGRAAHERHGQRVLLGDALARLAWLLILPTALIVFGVVLFPAIFSIWISFHDVGLKELGNVFEAEFVGLDNVLLDTPQGRSIVPGHAIESMWFMIHIYRRVGDQTRLQQAVETIPRDQ